VKIRPEIVMDNPVIPPGVMPKHEGRGQGSKKIFGRFCAPIPQKELPVLALRPPWVDSLNPHLECFLVSSSLFLFSRFFEMARGR